MPIESDKEIVLATSQTVNFRDLHVHKDADGLLTAEIGFDVLDENGKRVKSYQRRYEGEEYNTWWDSFNNGKFLYQEINTTEGLGADVSDDTEDDFINVIIEESND